MQANTLILEDVYSKNQPKTFREFLENLRDSKQIYKEISKMTVKEIRLFYDSKE